MLYSADEIWTEWHPRWQLFMQAAPVNLFQQWMKWIWKPSISMTQSSVQHVSLYIICVRNKFSQFCVFYVGVWNFGVLNVHTYINFGRVLAQICVQYNISHASVEHVCMCPHLCILWESWSLCLPHRVLLHALMLIYKRWNEDRKSNQCCRCLRAYRFPFHFPHSGKTKNDT